MNRVPSLQSCLNAIRIGEPGTSMVLQSHNLVRFQVRMAEGGRRRATAPSRRIGHLLCHSCQFQCLHQFIILVFQCTKEKFQGYILEGDGEDRKLGAVATHVWYFRSRLFP